MEGRVVFDENKKIADVKLIDVPSFAWELDRKIKVPEIGEILVDIGFGGMLSASIAEPGRPAGLSGP